MPIDPVKDVTEGWKTKNYLRVAKGLVVSYALGFVLEVIFRILCVVVPIVMIFVFDGSWLWALAGLVFFIDPMVFVDLVDLVTAPFQRRTPEEEATRSERALWRFNKVAAIVGLVALVFLMLRS